MGGIEFKTYPNKFEFSKLCSKGHESECGEKKRSHGDIYTDIQTREYAQLSCTDTRPSLLYSFIYMIPNVKMRDGTSHFRLIMWAHPQSLLILSRQSITAFVDGTFMCVPRLFKQCLILMVFDDETDLYVPFIHCLVQNKSE
ncbi:hypothetical protein RF11_00590 [Thelohanellus kitauei]|uniref:Uncharacterized protein n=1 Tax=Thelohanellus kitauei TaxID=669202 RepID=A0A0C2M198_THEKT|nr:hypothetical protein RF11_00590 [Thelohanellus kitauei]